MNWEGRARAVEGYYLHEWDSVIVKHLIVYKLTSSYKEDKHIFDYYVLQKAGRGSANFRMWVNYI